MILPIIQVLTGTSAMECGINSIYLFFGKHKGFTMSLYELYQELGRVDRLLTCEPGSSSYELHVAFDSYISLFLRIMQHADAGERRLQMLSMHEVVKFLLVPRECYHSYIERYFEVVPDLDNASCLKFCSHCCGHHKDFT